MTFLILLALGLVQQAFALRPIDSLIFGPNKKPEKDPLNFVFYEEENTENQSSELSYKKRLSLYSGYIHEGQNLKNRCDKKFTPLRYKSSTEYNEVKRSYLTTLQETGLTLAVTFLPHYADYFEFTKSEYKTMVDNLVGNYCSQNLSFISLRELKKVMMNHYSFMNKVDPPTVLGNPFFPDKLERLSSLTDIKKKEFFYTIELFKSTCSWGGQTGDHRLMTPLVSHPAIAAMVMRKMTSKKLSWDKRKEIVFLEETKDSEKILCENYICRNVKDLDYQRNMPRAIGSLDLRYDLEKLYCSEFKNSDYKIKNQIPKIKKAMKEKTFYARHSLAGQFIALNTGIPDFLMHVKENQNLDELYRSAMDRSWNRWAELEKNDRKRSLFFEESLVIKANNRDLRSLYRDRDIRIDLDITMGEYDRIGGTLGKIGATFTIPLKKEFLQWAAREAKTVSTKNELMELSSINEKVTARVRYVLRDIERKLDVVPWSGKEGLDRVIANSIISQLPHLEVAVNGQFSDLSAQVTLNYGMFALGYVRDIQQIQKREKTRLKESSILEKMASKKD